MKLLFYLLMVASPIAVAAQSVPDKNVQVNPTAKTILSDAAVVNLSRSAQVLSTTLTSTNGAEWLNTYQDISRNRAIALADKTASLEVLSQRSVSYIPDSWQFQVIQFLQSGKKDIFVLKRALALATEKADVYPYLIQYFISNKDETQVQNYVREYGKLVQLSPAIYQYYYNALMSVDEGATIYAGGLNDLVPMVLLQKEFFVRPDVTLRNYEGLITDTANVYLSLTIGAELLKTHPGATYSGLMAKLNTGNGQLSSPDHFKDFNTELLHTVNVLSKEQALLYQNYLPGFILSYKQHVKNDPATAEKLYELIINIARQSGNESLVIKMLARQ